MGCSQSILENVGLASKEPWKNFRKHPVHQKYRVGAKLGQGAFSQVHTGTNHTTGEVVALKVVFKERPGLKPSNIQVLRNEVAVLRALNHKNIIALKGVIEDDHQIVIILEKVNGPEMHEHLKKVGFYSESRAAHMFYQCVAAVNHMHEEGYLHRDLKTENVLIVEDPGKTKDDKLHIKVIDMGMALKISKDHIYKGVMGTPGYMAPECRGMMPHRPAMDVWSLGMILFEMLRGKLPYTKTQISKYLYTSINIAETDAFKSRTDDQAPFSPELEDLLMKMLKLDPDERITCSEILDHPWLRNKVPNAG